MALYGATVNALSDAGLKFVLPFLNYPLEAQPEPPGKSMPLTWDAPGFGYHCFRNGWQGNDEFIAQAFLKASNISGWSHPNAGTFAIQGLGHEWVHGSTDRVGFREQEPVVLLPDDQINEGACGQLVYRKVESDGSGILSIDMDEAAVCHARQAADQGRCGSSSHWDPGQQTQFLRRHHPTRQGRGRHQRLEDHYANWAKLIPQRTDVAYEEFAGHQLDRALLELLRRS